MLGKKSVLLFELTTYCNLNCTHCFGNKTTNNILQFSQIKLLLEKLSSYGIKDLILTGGEPFLRGDIFDIIHQAKKSGMENIGITTNGLLLDNKKIVLNIKKYLDVIAGLYIGINGATSKTHDYIRGIGQFDKLMKILWKRSLRKIPLGIDVCVGKWNLHELDDFFQITGTFNGSLFNFVPFIPLGIGKKLIDQVLSPKECNIMLEKVNEKKKEGIYVDLCFTPYAKIISENLCGCCNLLSEFLTITAQGEVVPCLYLNDYNLGSFLTNDLEQIYSNPKANYFLEPEKYKNQMNGYCNECPDYNICGGGCKVVSYALKGSIFETDPLCPFANK
ncbi:MAG: radical SAM protein [Candidatus Heimdallarchaeota archaeon]